MDAVEMGRRRFRTALAAEGLTLVEWARLNGYDRSHVSGVVNGDRVPGPVLRELMDAFIEDALHRAQTWEETK